MVRASRTSSPLHWDRPPSPREPMVVKWPGANVGRASRISSPGTPFRAEVWAEAGDVLMMIWDDVLMTILTGVNAAVVERRVVKASRESFIFVDGRWYNSCCC